jgi:hypothetical protein
MSKVYSAVQLSTMVIAASLVAKLQVQQVAIVPYPPLQSYRILHSIVASKASNYVV